MKCVGNSPVYIPAGLLLLWSFIYLFVCEHIGSPNLLKDASIVSAGLVCFLKAADMILSAATVGSKHTRCQSPGPDHPPTRIANITLLRLQAQRRNPERGAFESPLSCSLLRLCCLQVSGDHKHPGWEDFCSGSSQPGHQAVGPGCRLGVPGVLQPQQAGGKFHSFSSRTD